MILNSNVILHRQGIIVAAAELALVFTALIINSLAIAYPQAGADNTQFASAISSQEDNKDVFILAKTVYLNANENIHLQEVWYKLEHNLCITINCVTTAMHIHLLHPLLYSSETPSFEFTTLYKDDLIKRNS